jgi:hypothetical protein
MNKKHESIIRTTLTLLASLALWSALAAPAQAEEKFLPKAINSSTIPDNGDLNPYGVAFVPEGFPSGGTIAAGDVLVSNFNNAFNNAVTPPTGNIQGLGTTIIRQPAHGPIASPGTAITFFTSKLPGLSTALGVLRRGFVVVGNVPTTDGSFATIGQGALQFIDRHGKVIATLTDSVFLDGPWDLTIDDHDSEAHIFVSSVINGTVSRIDVAVSSNGVTVQKETTVAKGYTVVPSAAAVILGPTGLAYDRSTDTLFVASTAENAIYAVGDAAHRSHAANKGELVFADSHLIGPLALRFAPNGHLLTANGDATMNVDALHPSEIVEFTRWGEFVREYNVDASIGGAFGLDTVEDADGGFNFAFIDDVTSNLTITRLR